MTIPTLPADFPHKRAKRRLFYDTETSGLPGKGQPSYHPLYPTVMELTFIYEVEGLRTGNTYVKMFSSTLRYHDEHEYEVHPKAHEAHGLSRHFCQTYGLDAIDGLNGFLTCLAMTDQLIGHNIKYFDSGLMLALAHRVGDRSRVEQMQKLFATVETVDTLELNTDILRIPGARGGWKWPNLMETHRAWVGREFEGAHTSAADVGAVRRIYNAMLPPTVEG